MDSPWSANVNFTTSYLDSETESAVQGLKKSQNKEKPYACSVCKYRCSTEALLQRHTGIHTGEKTYPCNLCNFKATTPGYLKQHINKKHKGESSTSEVIVQLVYGTQSSQPAKFKSKSSGTVNQHFKTPIKEKIYACHICDYKSTSEKVVQRHARIHDDNNVLTCDICNYKSTTPGYLKQHILKKHTDYKSTLKKDSIMHTVASPHEFNTQLSAAINVCSLESGTARIIEQQLKNLDELYACTMCDFKCATEKLFQQHMRLHTGPKPKNLKTYGCKMCDFKSTKESVTKQHMKFHSVGKFYSCNLCDFKTTTGGYLKLHRFKHTGSLKSTLKEESITLDMLKPFACNKCDFRSSYKKSLKDHVGKQASDSKPYECESCDFKSVCPSHLSRHAFEKGHKEKPRT